MELTCFKAYDIRGELGTQLNEEIAERIGMAFAQVLKPKSVVVGGDVRETSESLKLALAKGLQAGGVDVLDIGLCGTEEIYFATSHLETDGGLMVTASHNPINYNGIKMVGKGSTPISADSGMDAIKALAESGEFEAVSHAGEYKQVSTVDAYIEKLLGYVDFSALRPMKLVMNAGNGAAVPTVSRLEEKFKALGAPIEFIKVNNEVDPTFPNGIPNPILSEQHPQTAGPVKERDADMGIAWDGDFDRCFLFDENGTFIEGYYIVGLLGEAFLQQQPGANIIYDPRLVWNTVEIVEANGGTAIQSKSGHSFIKERMRKEDAVYGGEMSAHHYFKDFAYCDSGMVPWLLVIDLLSKTGKSLGELVRERMAAYPSPGEINSKVADADSTIERVLAAYEKDSLSVDYTDGISVDMGEWRFNLRKSNTEPVIRLNLETRGDKALMDDKTSELLALIRQ